MIRFPSRFRAGRLVVPTVFALLISIARAEMVALWLFDEPVGAEIVPGKFGNALRPIATASREIPDREPSRHAALTNPTESRLNVGRTDWTLECWLKLDGPAMGEGTLFEVGTGPRGENELLTRISVLPRENAIVVRHLAPVEAHRLSAAAQRVEFPNPEGPPQGEATVESTTLAARSPLPRDTWFHVAVVHDAGSEELRLFIDGKMRATARARMLALPHGARAYVSVGRDGQRGRLLEGVLDELRISDAVVYAGEFAPPGSFARLHTKSRGWAMVGVRP